MDHTILVVPHICQMRNVSTLTCSRCGVRVHDITLVFQHGNICELNTQSTEADRKVIRFACIGQSEILCLT